MDYPAMTYSEMTLLDTIQKENKLNAVYRLGDVGPGGAYHDYAVVMTRIDETNGGRMASAGISFQKGPRTDHNARMGVLDCDLLEIVRDRLTAFQAGPYACVENAQALFHIEEALGWMAKRVEDRAKRNVLGTYDK